MIQSARVHFSPVRPPASFLEPMEGGRFFDPPDAPQKKDRPVGFDRQGGMGKDGVSRGDCDLNAIVG